MKSVDPSKAKGYITKAEKSLEMAQIARERDAYDNAVECNSQCN